MSRITRTNQPLLAAQQYISQHLPELCGLPLRKLHILDGPPDAPRYAVAIETCVASVSPARLQCPGRCRRAVRRARLPAAALGPAAARPQLHSDAGDQ